MNKRHPNSSARFVAAIIATLVGAPALAQEDLKGAERIDMTAEVRALSQRMAVASCFVRAGIDAEAFGQQAAVAADSFDKLITALEKGDESMGLIAPDSRKIFEGILGVTAQWQPYAQQVRNMASGTDVDAAVDFIARQNLNLMYSTRYLASHIVNTYAIPPALLQSNALTIDIASRQRGLSEQMAKEACGIATGNTVLGNPGRLKNAMRLFDRSLQALKEGLPAAGVTVPPTDEIAAGLAEVAGSWAEVKPMLESITGDGTAEAAALTDIASRLAAIHDKSGELAGLYVTASKKGF